MVRLKGCQGKPVAGMSWVRRDTIMTLPSTTGAHDQRRGGGRETQPEESPNVKRQAVATHGDVIPDSSRNLTSRAPKRETVSACPRNNSCSVSEAVVHEMM